ncbi:dihydropteroate synthase [Tomitella fengzijianii]|uniref:dihydropteroate synthase n=1 Tax=Tomitella fengzijianii TaxID=2597660 RepID=A0A516X7C9_9ACTN|nr:dihydropteroate synthase [Tomitella fengzijianii]QDQ98974.1 dihydropteroate synthase [Tomitella fengzijianii]
MGILNVTADSFSDGGRYLERDLAVEHGLQLAAAGADIVDVGGESTRPGAHRVSAEVERSRVVPVIRSLVGHGISVSIDTMRASVAGAAVEAGASVINDVSGGRADAGMARVAAEAGVPWILMHWRAAEASGQYVNASGITDYGDRGVVPTVIEELRRQVDLGVAAGVAPENIVLDPGLGFAKTGADNWKLLAQLPLLVAEGFPVLVGASRKRFLGALLPDGSGDPRPPAGRDGATAAVSLIAAQAGVWGVRVHDARGSRDALAVLDAWPGAGGQGAE